MFDYRKANRTVSQPPRSRSKSTTPSMASNQSQATGLAYIRTLKANLQRSASQILTPPTSAAPSPASASDTINLPSQTEAERQAEAAMLDEKDRIAVANELQEYLEEGVLHEEEYKDFSLTRYWQVSCYEISAVSSSNISIKFLGPKIPISFNIPSSDRYSPCSSIICGL